MIDFLAIWKLYSSHALVHVTRSHQRMVYKKDKDQPIDNTRNYMDFKLDIILKGDWSMASRLEVATRDEQKMCSLGSLFWNDMMLTGRIRDR
ncbi:hypothetical protein ACFO0E_02090 [Chromohalobacter beijerinckii]|uniref:Uncharacterized protein n=1 Tax=Chromohalobacter beijerinckii TaxID=86179 RepID=A0ABV8XBB8_9GAMM|nr:hypothetical protein [Chromohalobacter beijerinckii]MCK0766784.1 hypothetical protein [Chromohalobacter beijerinckii]